MAARADGLADELIGRLTSLFEAGRDDERAAGAAAYMRDQFVFFGIPSPEQQRIARDATTGLRAPSEAELRRVALACWERDEREWQYFACAYLRKHIGAASPSFIATARKLITSKPWWDTIDALAIRTVGPLVRAHPDLVDTMDEWIGSDDFWLARTAILHQLTYKTDTDVGRLFDYCLRRSSDKEFFIRKAIGWALREYTKTGEQAVRAFLDQHGTELSGLSRTEALKWLERRARRADTAPGA